MMHVPLYQSPPILKSTFPGPKVWGPYMRLSAV